MVGGLIIKDTSDVRMAELLEPEKGKNHPVRGALSLSPEDKQVKKAVNEVLEKHGVKVKWKFKGAERRPFLLSINDL